MEFQDAHLYDETVSKYKKVISVKVRILLTFRGSEELCWHDGCGGVVGVAGNSIS